MEVKKLTSRFYDYMNTNSGMNKEDIENMLMIERRKHIEKYIKELEREIYKYSMIIAQRTNYKIEKTEYNILAGEYEITVIKRLLSVSIYMKKPKSRYKKLFKCFSLKTLEKTIQELKKQMTLKEIIYV